MNNKLSQVLITATTLAMGTFTIQTAQAAILNFDVNVNIDSGPLNGESYSGSFRYDNSSLTGVGDESVALSSIDFNFFGVDYDENNGTTPDAIFLDNDFLGLSWSADSVEFSFVPGFTSIDQAFFAYDILGGAGAGAGDITFTQDLDLQDVPESNSVIGLLLLGGLASLSLIKKKSEV